MKFNDGKFKILILSDIHTSDEMPVWTEQFIEKAIKTEAPDLIVLLGDNTAGEFTGVTKEKTYKAIDNILKLIGEMPFCVVFGNHDHEGMKMFDEITAKKELLSVYKTKSNCLAQQGSCSSGVGNYRIGLENSEGKEVYSLWFIDSGTYNETGKGYAYVKKDCIDYIAAENERTNLLPSMLFQHIIVPEIYNATKRSLLPLKGFVRGDFFFKGYYKLKKEYLVSGVMKERPCPPYENSGQFSALQKQGNFKAMFFGHDHTNNFDVLYKDVRLIAVPSPSFYTYGNNRGVRTVTLFENDLSHFETRVIAYEELMDIFPSNPIVRKKGIQHFENTLIYKLCKKVKKQ